MPILADCSIRLNQGQHTPLRKLAVETAVRAKGWEYTSREDESPFRFMNLPRELRLQILQYTDLVTPLKEVEWNPKDNFYLHYRSSGCPRYSGEYDLCGDEKQHYGCQFRSCWENDEEIGCFCQLYHSSYSSRCQCWSQPTPLFLVCRVLCEDARAVFFSMNHFIIAPVNGCIEPAETPDDLEILTFLKDTLPPTALHYLKSLEIVFPPFRDDYLRPHEQAYNQWLQAIDYMCQLNLPMLGLSIIMADPMNDRRLDEEHFRARMNAEKAKTIVHMYFRTIRPLSKLRQNGLEAFFLTFADPYAHCTSLCSRHNQPISWCRSRGLNQSILRKTKQAEREVMGEDYDSAMMQSRAHGESQWLREKDYMENEC